MPLAEAGAARRHTRLAGTVLLAAGFLIASCGGGSSPVTPTPPALPPSPNTPPVIESLVAGAERVDVGDPVTLTATVRDSETAPAQLRYEWSAPAGTIETPDPGVARWRPAAELATPADYRVTLTVIELYGPGNTQEHRVSTTSPAIRVHHSPRELALLATTFLQEFSTSSVAPATVIREFSEACPGKQDELADVQRNRDQYVITSFVLGTPSISVRYGGGCSSLPHGQPVRSPVADACITMPVEWHSTERSSGRAETARGTAVLSAIYHDRRWWLCDSQFAAPAGTLSPIFGR